MGDPILEKSYSNKKAVGIRKAINEAHRYVLKKFNYSSIVDALSEKLRALNVPLWVKHQPLFTWSNMYEDMNQQKRGKELVNLPPFQFWGNGKITKKGLFVGFPAIWNNNTKSRYEAVLIPKEYEFYWKDFDTNIGMKWEDGKDLDDVIKEIDKKNSVDDDVKVIDIGDFEGTVNKYRERGILVNPKVS